MLSRIAVLVCLLASAPTLAQSVTVYEQGKVFTSRTDVPEVEAVAVREGRVIATGSNHTLRTLYPNATRVSLRGRRVVPALVDAHAHVAPLALPDWLVNAPDFVPAPGPSADEVVALATARAAIAPPGTPILAVVGMAWYAGLEGRAPRDVLDAVSTQHPVIAVDWTGHGLSMNSQALAASGFSEGMADPHGGRMGRDATGRLTGTVQEMAAIPTFRFLSGLLPRELYVGAYAAYAQASLQMGFGAVFDIPFVLSDADTRWVISQQTTRLKYYQTCFVDSPTKLCAPDPIDGVVRRKIVGDGGPNDCTTHISVPYLAPDTCPAAVAPWYGLQDVSDADIDFQVQDVRTRGGLLMFHAVGDAAVAQLLRRVVAADPLNTTHGRITLEHGDLMTPAQVSEVAGLGMPVVQNPLHLVAVAAISAPRMPASVLEHAEPLRSLLDAGILLALGEDAFGAPTSPWTSMAIATTHPMQPTEAITRAQYLRAYTAGSHRARLTGHTGTLTAGQPASFAVLSQDVLDEVAVPASALAETTSLLTVVDGQVAYSTGALVPATP